MQSQSAMSWASIGGKSGTAKQDSPFWGSMGVSSKSCYLTHGNLWALRTKDIKASHRFDMVTQLFMRPFKGERIHFTSFLVNRHVTCYRKRMAISPSIYSPDGPFFLPLTFHTTEALIFLANVVASSYWILLDADVKPMNCQQRTT